MNAAYKAMPVSKRNIADFAWDCRKSCGCAFIKEFPIVQYLELIMPRMFPGFTLEIAEAEEMPFKEGETIPGTDTIRLRRDIYEAACNGDGRARFTVAHEIGHFMLHTPDSIILCRMEEGQGIKKYEDPEWQANVFASELLAPVYLAKGMTAHQIAEEFKISESAAHVVVSKCLKESIR